MGAGIHTEVEQYIDGEWVSFEEKVFPYFKHDGTIVMRSSPFECKNYELFGFLSDVRNYACIPVIAERRGLPEVDQPDFGTGLDAIFMERDYEAWPLHTHNHSGTWLLVSELMAYDYDTIFENRRGDTIDTVPKGNGVLITVRESIGDEYFEHLEILKSIGDPDKIRVIISFDS